MSQILAAGGATSATVGTQEQAQRRRRPDLSTGRRGQWWRFLLILVVLRRELSDFGFTIGDLKRGVIAAVIGLLFWDDLTQDQAGQVLERLSKCPDRPTLAQWTAPGPATLDGAE